MIIRYNLFSFSVNASSVSSVKLVIILKELGRDGFKNLDCYFAITGRFFFFIQAYIRVKIPSNT